MALASRRRGVTARALAEAAGVALRTAQATLSALVTDGLLRVEVPSRKGCRRGEWPNVYYTGEVPKR